MPADLPVAGRRLALFDLDGTLTRRDTFAPFVLLLTLRHPARWIRLPWIAVLLVRYLTGGLDRGGVKGELLHLLFGGLHRARMATFAEAFAADSVPGRMHAQALQVVRQHLDAGDHVVVLSASPDVFVPQIARRLGAHEVYCTEVRWNGDRLDGRLAGPNRRDHEKAVVLKRLRAAHPGLPVIAYGNSEPDLIHMRECEQAVYVNASAQQAAGLTAEGFRCVQWR